MKGPQGYATIVNIAMNVLLGLIISIAVLLYMGTFMPVPLTAEAVIGSTVSSFFVGFAVGMLLPIMDWAFAIIGALKVKNGFVQYLIIACTLGVCMGVCITCGNAIISQIGVGGWPAGRLYREFHRVHRAVRCSARHCVLEARADYGGEDKRLRSGGRDAA